MTAATARFDAVIIGGGHNGLTCAAYLAGGRALRLRARAPRRVGRRRGHRGIPSRLSQLDGELHGQPAQSQGDPGPAARAARTRRSSSGRSRISCRCPRADYLKVGGGLGATQAEVARYSRRDAETLPAYYAMLDRVADVLRELVLATPPAVGGGIGALLDAWKVARRFRALDLAGRRDVLDLFTKSAGEVLDRWFESEPDQGGARLRRGRRQFRESVHAGVRLRAAAPRVRRGERQAGAVGPRARRDGRDHAGDGGGMQGARRRRCAPTPPSRA